MLVRDIIEKLDLSIVAGENALDNEITTVYVGDLLSWVMANAKQGSIWIPIQSHVNIVAVASLLNLSCIIVAEGAHVDEEAIEKANNENIPIFSTDKDTYNLIKELIKIGIE